MDVLYIGVKRIMHTLKMAVLALIMLVAFCACDSADLRDGYYLMESSPEDVAPPYALLDTQAQWMRVGQSLIESYSQQGHYIVDGSQLIVNTQNARFVFFIQDSDTLILSEHSSTFDFPENARFVYNEGWSES